jgi:hypothetical protein
MWDLVLESEPVRSLEVNASLVTKYRRNAVWGMGPKSNRPRERFSGTLPLRHESDLNGAHPGLNIMKISIPLLVAIVAVTAGNFTAKSAALSPDPGWPRQRTNEQGRLVYYQPQVDAWTNFKNLSFRMAFSLTPKGGKEIVGVMEVEAQTDVNMDDHSVLIRDFKINEIKLPGMDPTKASAVEQTVRGFLPPDHTVVMALERLVASVEKSEAPAPVQVQNTPPQIFTSNTPAILLNVDGEGVRADIDGTNLGFFVNANFPLFYEKESPKEYYLFTGQQWLKSTSIEGGWAPAPKLPPDFTKVANDPKWTQMKTPILTPSAKGKPPTVFYSSKPAEVILFQGQPNYANIPGTQLSAATNTDADLFIYNPTKDYYYLTAGRWFQATNLKGPWTFTTEQLPPDFANIPENSPAARVLTSVPGTDEAKDAVLMAQVPTTAEVNPEAAQQAKVSYTGEPEFKPIEGTSLQYATNTADKVIKVGDLYYLCLQGVWFMSPSATGPWTTANSVPKDIYSIPPSSPVYNVTYVTQTTSPSGTVQSSYTAGYLGTFIAGAAVGAILANGTGYYYPPYYGYPVGGYPVYHPYPCTYGVGAYYNSGAYYGTSKSVYGPYGGTAATGTAYNPYTGTYARGATASGPYGTQSVAQAYNPYTGTYAATHQGSNAYSSWGQSVVSNGNKSAYTQHYSNANGTVATAQGSQGGKAAASSTKYGSSAAAKTSSGNMYATHDGNVYKNTGSGWSSYNNGSWNSVNSSANKNSASSQYNSSSSQSAQNQAKSAQSSSSSANKSYNSQSAQKSAQSAQSRSSGSSEADRASQNQQRGASESSRFSQSRSGGGGGGWGGRGGGGGGEERGGGGRRR